YANRGVRRVFTEMRGVWRGAPGPPMKTGKGDAALAAAPRRQYARVQSSKRHAHVGRMCCDAMLAGAKDCMHPIEPFERRTAAARLALITGRRGIVKIQTPRALQKIAAGCRHVA